MDTLVLKCWVHGDDSYTTFHVNIARTETVGSLKKVIKDKNSNRFASVDACNLILYSIPMPGSKHFETTLKQWTFSGQTCLDNRCILSVLNLSDSLVIVHPSLDSLAAGPSTVVPDMTLNCWVRGESIGQMFTVEISGTKIVAKLKEVIKDKKPVTFGDVDANQLTLYKVSLPYGEACSVGGLGARTIASLVNPLQDFHKLAAIFMPLPADNQLHLIVDGLGLAFQCWVRGAEPPHFVRVKISMDAMVGDLENAIKAAYSNGMSPGRLKLYKIPVNEEAEFREHLTSSALGSGQLLQVDELVIGVFNDVPFSQMLRVVVEPIADRYGPSLTGSTTGNKREHSEEPFEANKRIRHDFAALPMPTPSMIATPSYFQEHYQKKHVPRIRCGRPDENQCPFPLVLAHRIFATFVSECETYKPHDKDLMFILDLSHCMCQFFADEKDRKSEFRACMKEYGITLTEGKIEGIGSTTDGDARVGALPYLISVGKEDFGASFEDPYIQTAAYHMAATQSWLRVHPDDLRALPCIHVFYNGPVIGFAGSMLTEKFDVNVLGPILPLFYHPKDIDMQVRCAKAFGALKNSATALKEYYEHTAPKSFADTRFPWITQYDTTTPPTETREFEYVRQMEGNSLLYICQHIHDKKRILVKFVQTYSKDAHLASAAKDGAPALLGHCNILSCGWSVVVMELLEEPDWISGLKITDKAEQRTVCDKVREHVLTLHQRGFVHGDIRPQNVIVKRPDAGRGHALSVRLVDFESAGETNKAKYPLLLNLDLGFKRPSGVKGGNIITTEHDLAMVDLMYSCPA